MNPELYLYKIDPQYIKYMHGIDYRISVKYNNRPFVGIKTMINGINYVIPLTSKTTSRRAAEGRAKRSSRFTTFIRDSKGNEIANILYNNMFPVKEGVYTKLDIDEKVNVFESKEIRFIRKHSGTIIAKAHNVYFNRTTKCDPHFYRMCCDFKKLESFYMDFDTLHKGVL